MAAAGNGIGNGFTSIRIDDPELEAISPAMRGDSRGVPAYHEDCVLQRRTAFRSCAIFGPRFAAAPAGRT